MTSTQVLDLKGKKVGDVDLEDSVFGIEPSQGPLHQAVVRQLSNARSGSASSKTRSEISGGGAKPWRQKGTGRARAGSSRSPLWRHGGVIFGPKPRSFFQSMPRKMRRVAVRSALSARREELIVVKDFESIKEPKTKAFASVLKDLSLSDSKVLLVLDFACDNCKTVQLAARNIKGLKVIHADNLNVKDLLEYDSILTTERTLKSINEKLKTEKKAAPEKAEKPKAKKTEKTAVKEKKAPTVKSKEPKEKAPKAAKAPKEPKEAKEPKAEPKTEKEGKKAEPKKAPAKKPADKKDSKKK